MGYLVGELLGNRASKAGLEYIKTLLQPDDADSGEPVPAFVEDSWVQRHERGFQTAGWRLNKVDLELNPAATRRAGNLDGSAPDPYMHLVILESDGEQKSHDLPWAHNTLKESWKTNLILWTGQTGFFSVPVHHEMRADTDL